MSAVTETAEAAQSHRVQRPSSGSVRLADEMRALRGSNAAAVIAALTPIIRGWAALLPGSGVQQDR